MNDIAAKVLEGDQRSIAKLITHAENGSPLAAKGMKKIHPHTGNAYVIGITGVMGSGKSTLIYELSREYRRKGLKVGIIAIDVGAQENVSGTFNGYPTYVKFYVYDNYSLNLTSNHSIYMRGENITIQALDINSKAAEVNWTVNITKMNGVYNFTDHLGLLGFSITK